MIQKNYIITAHKNPEQLGRLIDRLNDFNSKFYIHIDEKSDIQEFQSQIKLSNVYFIKNRVNCIWGDYSQVIATLNLLEVILKENSNSHVIFLSGQDYPIKNNKEINLYLNKNSSYDFIDYDLSPIEQNSKIYKQRIEKYKFNLSDKRGDFLLLSNEINFKELIALSIRLIKKGKNILSIFYKIATKRNSIFENHYKGTNWWAFKISTARKVYDYYQDNKKYLDNYYKYTLCADEQFFHTILKEIMKNDKSINILPNLHFIDWSRKGVTLPVTFKSEDLDLLLNQPKNKLFARKFDIQLDDNILNQLDKHIKLEH